MKFFIAFALIAAVASAAVITPSAVSSEVQEIIAAINNPSTDPATAVALEQMLLDLMGVAANPEPVIVGPAIIDAFEPVAVGPAIVDSFEPIAVGPAIVDFPIPDGGVVTAPAETAIVAPVAVAPVAVPTPADSATAPLVQIILNINQAATEAAPVAVAPVAVAPTEVQPTPVSVVETAEEVMPVIVVESAPEAVQVVEPVIVVETAPVVVDPVQVIETAPIAVEPVIIGTPIIPSPAVTLPEELN